MLATAGPTVAPRWSTIEAYERSRAGPVSFEIPEGAELGSVREVGEQRGFAVGGHRTDGDHGAALRAAVRDDGSLLGVDFSALSRELVHLDELVAVVMEHRESCCHAASLTPGPVIAHLHSSPMEQVPLHLDDLSDDEVEQAIRANWIEYYASFDGAPGVELSRGPFLSWVLTGIPDAFLNVVFRTDVPPHRSEEVIDDALRYFKARQVAFLSWWAPALDVGRVLTRRGLSFLEGGSAMAADLASVPDDVPQPDGLSIETVEDRTMLASWVRVMRIGFGTPKSAQPDLVDLFAAAGSMPSTQAYVALIDDRPVATSQLLVAAGVAGVYNVTCLPDARGRGIGTAVTLAPLLEARRRGYRMAILQASDLGRPVYRRLGFRDYGRLNEYRFTLT